MEKGKIKIGNRMGTFGLICLLASLAFIIWSPDLGKYFAFADLWINVLVRFLLVMIAIYISRQFERFDIWYDLAEDVVSLENVPVKGQKEFTCEITLVFKDGVPAWIEKTETKIE